MADYREGQRLQGSDGRMYVVQGGVPRLAPGPVAVTGGDPTVPFKTTEARNSAAASGFAPRKEQVGIQKTEAEIANDAARVRLERQQFEANLAEKGLALDPQGNVVPRRGGSILPPKPDAKQQIADNRQIADLRSVANQLNRVQELYNSDFRGGGLGSVGEYLPTPRNQRFDSQARALATLMKPLIRGAGEGTWTDADQRLLDRLVPSSFASDIDNEDRIATAKRFIEEKVAKLGGSTHRERVGGKGDLDPQMSSQVDAMVDAGIPLPAINAALEQQNFAPLDPDSYAKAAEWKKQNPGQRYFGAQIQKPQSGYESSALGQGLSGVNEGIASVLGAPVDLASAAINAGTSGINALAGTQIPRIENPFLGSAQIQRGLKAVGSIAEPTPGGAFARRVGQSIGAAAIPLGRTAYGAQLLMGAGGGIGGATAQQAFPGNPLAEIGGELLGGGAAAGGLTRVLKRSAQRGIEAAVPTVPELKQQAGQLYRAAESRGVVADPAMTQRLNDDIRQALTDEGRLSPTGRITEAYPKAKEATQLIGDYAGQQMTPTQMQSVRKVISDGLSSPEPAERRLSGILTDTFDNFANPLAPELSEARDISSRYLTAQQLEKARELAGARASQFTGSGFENALRTEYRGLDRAAIKGNARFSNDVSNAIEKVARGTPTSNALRGLGRLAPTGPVSGMGSIMSGLGVGAMTDPFTGGLAGLGVAGAGMFGRAGATHMGIRAADQAELVARNGGALPTPILSPEWQEIIRRLGLAESAKYLPE